MLTKRHGFTLVEIMIVVAIVAVLVAIAIPNFLLIRTTSSEAFAQATLKTINTAMENYITVNNEYPTQTSFLVGDAPPYLNVDFFTGVHHGYSFTPMTLTGYDYTILAFPSNTGTEMRSFSITNAGTVIEN